MTFAKSMSENQRFPIGLKRAVEVCAGPGVSFLQLPSSRKELTVRLVRFPEGAQNLFTFFFLFFWVAD